MFMSHGCCHLAQVTWMHRSIQILIYLWMYNIDALHSIGWFLPGWCDAQRLDGKFHRDIHPANVV